MIYRVQYTREIAGAATVYGSFDLTQEHVDVEHEGCIETALMDSSFNSDWSRVTGVEKLAL